MRTTNHKAVLKEAVLKALAESVPMEFNLDWSAAAIVAMGDAARFDLCLPTPLARWADAVELSDVATVLDSFEKRLSEAVIPAAANDDPAMEAVLDLRDSVESAICGAIRIYIAHEVVPGQQPSWSALREISKRFDEKYAT